MRCLRSLKSESFLKKRSNVYHLFDIQRQMKERGCEGVESGPGIVVMTAPALTKALIKTVPDKARA